MKKAYIAVDFGGGSGRVITGVVSAGTLTLNEVHRFTNRQVKLGGHIYWNFLSLFDEMVTGLRKAVDAGYRIESIGIDTWGVDFGLIDAEGNLLSNPVCYRDHDTCGSAAEFFGRYDTPEHHYSEAGIQIMDINTLFRLVKMKDTAPAIMAAADKLLFTPDLFSYFLTGNACNEYTIATTSGLIDARTRSWNHSLIERCGLPEHLFCPIVMPGATRGHLTEEIKREIGIDYDVDVVAVGSHDTASAVYTVNSTYATDGTAYLSSGTWSLLGVMLDEPILTDEARECGFTNEGGVGRRITFLQNITGLWILQQLMGQWKDEGLTTDYDILLADAEKSAIDSVIDVDHPTFHSPHSMSGAIADYCRENGMAVPRTQGEFVKCVVQSLATRYAKGIDALNRLLPSPVKRLQIIGGGSRNKLLNRLTSEKTGIPVDAGPVEATAIGNILIQAMAGGEIKNTSEIKSIKND